MIVKSLCYIFLFFLKFISVRLFPSKTNELPPDEKCTWWIPAAVKVLALLSMALLYIDCQIVIIII